ncbi:hypothetical protein [Microbulbifer celer]|uniref:Uncharacterized protein n=1 Tax=Microbulbifer celer TaxID=435905 RepID=A0ABW3UBJ6_9GAMM|nr:hypothetical protein [Microbulbifer celer]UFN56011.1 hypothetical protein LPW13_10525 [Microbulbifer celer]
MSKFNHASTLQEERDPCLTKNETYENIMNAAEATLRYKNPEDISTTDLILLTGYPEELISDHFSNINMAITALAERHTNLFCESVDQVIPPNSINNWKDITSLLFDICFLYYKNHESALKLHYGPQLSRAQSKQQLKRNSSFSRIILNAISRNFDIPYRQEYLATFWLAVTVYDCFCSLSFSISENISKDSSDKGKSAAIAYIEKTLGKEIDEEIKQKP